MKAITLFLFVCVCAFAVHAQTHTIVRVSKPGAVNPGEVSIAIDPANPDNIIGTSFQYGASPQQARVSNYVYVSKDGGKTWETVASQNTQKLSQGDDVVTFGRDGTAYHSYISFEGIRVQRPKRATSGILISSSKDGGATWSEPVPAVNHINSVTPFSNTTRLRCAGAKSWALWCLTAKCGARAQTPRRRSSQKRI
jgi:hypothetical protein